MRRVRFVEHGAFAVRRDLVDDALVAGAGEEIALRVRDERPDIFFVGAEERRRGAIAIDLVDAAIGGSPDVQAAVRRERERVRFELRAVEEQRALALRVDLEDLAFVAGADEYGPVRLRDHRPQKRRRRFIDQLGGRSERQLAVAVDREILDVAFQEFALSGGLEEFGRRRLQRQRCKRDKESGRKSPHLVL